MGSISLEASPETKQVICDYLRRKNADLSKFQAKVIDEIFQRIKELKSQLKTAIDEIERVKHENSALIDRIMVMENVSENNDLGKFLILEPGAAMESIQNEICRIDYKKFTDYIECEYDFYDISMKGDEITIFRDNTKKLLRYNLNDQTIKEAEIPIKHTTNIYCSICKIPNGNLICFGGHPSYTTATFMIYPDNSIKYLASSIQPRGVESAIYYKKEIYAFGGCNSRGLILTPEKYNIKVNEWKPFSNLKVGANCCTGFGYKNKNFFTGIQHSKIYIYDIRQNSYSEIPIELNPQSGKVLILKRNTFYLISNSSIYEFDAENYGKWLNVESSSFSFAGIGIVSHLVEFKNCFYFFDTQSYLYKFDLQLNSIEKKEI